MLAFIRPSLWAHTVFGLESTGHVVVVVVVAAAAVVSTEASSD